MGDEKQATEDRGLQSEQNYRALVDGNDAVAQEIRALLHLVVARDVSEIHIGTQDSDDAAWVRVRLQVMGVMHKHRNWSPELGEGVIARFLEVAGMPARSVGAQIGQCEATIPAEGDESRRFSMRLTLMPARSGPSLMVRLMPSAWAYPSDLSLESLFPAGESDTAALLRSALAEYSGLVVIAARPDDGRGKTMSAAMHAAAMPERAVASIEDSVEMIVPWVDHLVCTPHMSYADGIRRLLGMHMKTIIVGEVADGDTAAMVVEASRPGRLVVAGVEANNAVSAVSRLVNLGADRSELADNLSLVVAQRLVRRPCRACSAEEAGCSECIGGYDGCVPVAETLQLDEQARGMLAGGEPTRKLQEANQYGRFVVHASSLIDHEVTTLAELVRVFGENWNQEQ